MTEKLQDIIRILGKSKIARICLHLIFWLIVGYFYYLVFSRNSDFPKVSLIFTMGLLPVAILETYVFNYILIPRYLSPKRYFRFFYLSAMTVLVSTWLSFLIVFYALINLLLTESAIEPAILNPELQVISLNFIVFLAIAIKQVKRTFYMQLEKNELEKTQLSTELKLKEAELKLLKAQVHPHFLFNTLNNLYGLTLEKSDEAPQLVLQLSEILDYILYRCDAPRVLLSEDLSNLRNYIDIEKIRYSEKLELQTEITNKTGNLKIAPLLLLPFVENAFKHGVSHYPGIAFVRILATIIENKLIFEIENTRNPLAKKNENGSNGIGMKNVKRRLDLLYPQKYILSVKEKNDTFSVNLTLELEE